MLSIYSSSKGDNDLGNTCVYGIECILYLGQHATANGTVCLVALEVGMIDSGYHAVIVIWIEEHAFLLKREDEGNIIQVGQCLGSF